MNKTELENELSSIPLSALRYYDQVGSTNDEALIWASQDAPDLSLVIADEQTSGRGRMQRKWFTPAKSALAMSLIIRPTGIEQTHPSRASGLLALSLSESLLQLGLAPQIKWPNDVLLDGKKVAGILVETVWTVQAVDLPERPATSIETKLGYPLDRIELLKDILTRILVWRPKLGTDEFLSAWEEKLAFRGQQVQAEGGSGESVIGELLGLESDGSLRIRDVDGKSVSVRFGEVHLRPMT